jgi:hypothetical protein
MAKDARHLGRRTAPPLPALGDDASTRKPSTRSKSAHRGSKRPREGKDPHGAFVQGHFRGERDDDGFSAFARH